MSISAPPHHLPCANGKSIDIVYIVTSPNFAASWLKRLTSVSHTGVSNDGTVKNTLLPLVSLNLNGFKSLSTTVKSGAVSPTFT